MKILVEFLFWWGVTYIVCMLVYALGLKIIRRQDARERNNSAP